ncbi:MAG: NAD(P)-dependent oxidoreductase, partial [Gammaproteobacteria bacterium]
MKNPQNKKTAKQNAAKLPAVGFIGIGLMGAPMANNLLRGGFSVAIYDRAPKAAAQFAGKRGCRIAASPEDAADNADILICMLPNSRITRDALFGKNGAAKKLRRGALVLEMGTGDLADFWKTEKRLRARGVRIMDAPVGRSRREAASGDLLIMAGGDAKTVAPLRPLLSVLGSDIICGGATGAGLKLKMVNNYISIVNCLIAAEGLAFAEVLDLPRKETMSVLEKTPAGRGHFLTTYPRKVLRGDIAPDFGMALALKDMRLALKLGARENMPLLLGRAAKKRMEQSEEFGHLKDDWTALFCVMQKLAAKQ